MGGRRAVVCSVLGLLAALALPATGSTARAATATGTPLCGTATAPPPATFQHVVWIVFEDKKFSSVVHSSSAPYLNSVADDCGLATNYHTGVAATLPSLPHYLAMTSGSTQGVTDNAAPAAHPLAAPSIFGQLGTGGWRALQQSMPSNCAATNAGSYAVRNNPAAYYTDARSDCAAQDVPLGTTPDISAPFTFLVPDLQHDMHYTSAHPTVASQVSAGDAWLAQELPAITATDEYQSGGTAIFITWDEGDRTTDHVPTLVVSPYTRPGTRGTGAYSHYALLRTTEDALGLARLDAAADPATPSMAEEFGLAAPAVPTAAPCGSAGQPPVVTHVVWVVMENKSPGQLLGSADAPYVNGLAAQCGAATNVSQVATKLDKIPMTAGDTFGITDDGPPAQHPLDVPSIFSELGTGGWRSLQESMPANCRSTDSGDYVVRHNAAAYYTNIATDCAQQDVPLGELPDLSAPFTFVTPNIVHDMHQTSLNRTMREQVRAGDAWLAQEMPKILASPEYQSGSTVVFLTWDQGWRSPLVPTLVLSPWTTPGSTDGTAYSHYSMLRTTQELLGLSPLLGNAATATPFTGLGLGAATTG